jgi:hypothetical protein
MKCQLGKELREHLQKLAGGAALSLDLFVKADSVFVAAIVVAAILALFAAPSTRRGRCKRRSRAPGSGRQRSSAGRDSQRDVGNVA